MTLRTRTVATFAAISLVSTLLLVASVLYLTRSALDLWEKPAIEKGLEIAVTKAETPEERAEAIHARMTYFQLKGIKGLIERRIVGVGVAFGVIVFGLSLLASGLILMRITRPLKELTRAIGQAGTGDLNVQIASPPRSEVGQVAHAFNEMTARLRVIQEDLKRAERLAAWRDVARILGHEIRNPLTPIRLNVERLKDKYDRSAPDYAEVMNRATATILKEIDALDRLVSEFSEFARLPSPTLKPTDLNCLIEETVAPYRASQPRVVFESKLDPALPMISLDPQMMHRVFVNLIKNALDALPESGGKISIATALQNIPRNEGKQTAVVTISDNGQGIPEEVIGKVFQPYFTTKTKGTGLGLAVVKQIVDEHRGEIKVSSEPGRGTTFEIKLPT
jgi:nitrogen fixation/metabolism regulation signal transduction histidine kinase